MRRRSFRLRLVVMTTALVVVPLAVQATAEVVVVASAAIVGLVFALTVVNARRVRGLAGQT